MYPFIYLSFLENIRSSRYGARKEIGICRPHQGENRWPVGPKAISYPNSTAYFYQGCCSDFLSSADLLIIEMHAMRSLMARDDVLDSREHK